MNKWIQNDERTDSISGRAALAFLELTQAGIFLMIIYQRYIQGRPPEYYNDLALILAVSVVGFWMITIYLGGLIPTLSARRALFAYLGTVLLIALPYTLIRGLPDMGLLPTWGLVIFGGPALLIGGYSLAAYLGRLRLNHLINQDHNG